MDDVRELEQPIPGYSNASTSAAGLFVPGVAEKIGFYVYFLIDPREDSVFYVGKGTGNRCFAHVLEARNTRKAAVGDFPKLDRIRDIERAGAEVQIDILRHGLSEGEAFLVESVAIDLLTGLTNEAVGHGAVAHGRMSVVDINAKYGATPIEIHPDHCVVLIRINETFGRGLSDTDLYEKTRKWWRVGPTRRQGSSPPAPKWAMAVFGGIVRAVYRIDNWEKPSQDHTAKNSIDRGRWGFQGVRDGDMEVEYLYRDVSRYLISQNPIRYVNCGGRSVQ